eukprot:RCo045845
MSGSLKMAAERVRVALRVRPFTEAEAESNDPPCVEVTSGSTVSITNRRTSENFVLDQVFWSAQTPSAVPFSGQQDVFHRVGLPMLQSVLQGVSATLVAYGAPQSGKSFTLLGTPDDLGLLPRTAMVLFSHIRRQEKATEHLTHSTTETAKIIFSTQVSVFKLVGERCVDKLLGCVPAPAGTEFPSDAALPPLTRVTVRTWEELRAVLSRAALWDSSTCPPTSSSSALGSSSPPAGSAAKARSREWLSLPQHHPRHPSFAPSHHAGTLGAAAA